MDSETDDQNDFFIVIKDGFLEFLIRQIKKEKYS